MFLVPGNKTIKSGLRNRGLISSTTGSLKVGFSRVGSVTQEYQGSWLFSIFSRYSQNIEDVSLLHKSQDDCHGSNYCNLTQEHTEARRESGVLF